MRFPCSKLTAAGTVQDSHLFPSQDFTTKILHHFAAAKIHFFTIKNLHDRFFRQKKRIFAPFLKIQTKTKNNL